MLATSLATPWKLILERLGRQLAQTVAPIVVAAGATPGHHELSVAVVAIAVSALVTVLKAVAGVRAKATDPIVKQLLDRAAPAFAGTLVGFIPADVANMASVDWSNVFWASVTAGVAAVAAYYITPPSNVVAVATDPLIPTPGFRDDIPGEAEVEEREALEPVDDDLP